MSRQHLCSQGYEPLHLKDTTLKVDEPGYVHPQLLSTFALVALLAVANWLHHRSGKVAPIVESSERAKAPVLID